MKRVVVDASAWLAFLRVEPGAEVAVKYLLFAAMSAVNLSEVLETCVHKELAVNKVLALLKNWGIEIVPFDTKQATIAAEIKWQTGESTLLLSERACLALARSRGIPVLTSNCEWSKLDLGIEVIQIREGA